MPGIQAVALHAIALSESLAPEWVHLLPTGPFYGADGRGPYQVRDPQAVITASLAAGKLPIDENHATDLAAPSGASSPARGWIVAMEARPDGIWGRVEWTPSGTGLIADRAYRGISPAMQHDKSGDVVRLLRAALTNNPNLPLTALHMAGVVSLVDLSQTGRREKADLFVGLAIQAGKLPESCRDIFVSRHMRDPEGTEHLFVGVPALHTARAGGSAPAAPAIAAPLTPAQHAVCTTMVLDTAKFATQLHHQQVAASLSVDDMQVCQNMGLSPVLFAAAKSGGSERPANHGLSDAALMVAQKMGLAPTLFARTHARLSAEQKRKMTGEPASSADGLSEHEVKVCATMGLSTAGMAAEKLRTEPDGLDLTEAERTVCRTMGISPQAMAARKRNGGQGQQTISHHAALLSPEVKVAQKAAIDPDMEAIMREYGFTLENLNKTGITRAELLSYKEAGLTRADIEECRRSHISPKALIYARKMANEAPMWKAAP